MQCRNTDNEVEPERIAAEVLRCPDCGEFVDEATLVPLDPQPRVLIDLGGPDVPDAGWQHLTFAVTFRTRAWEDTGQAMEAIETFLEGGSLQAAVGEAFEDIEVWGNRPVGAQQAPVVQHDRLLDVYAQRHADAHGMPYDQARQLIDVLPNMQGLLGRNGNWESACKLAGIEPYEPTPIDPGPWGWRVR